MKEPGILASWMVRNPLGIIAAFISLIYGTSATLLGVAVNDITEKNQTVLVWFVVLFPCAVLIVFAWLVAKHHKKLYAPHDYRSDDGFLSAAENADRGTVGQRLRADIDASFIHIEEEAVDGDRVIIGDEKQKADRPSGQRAQVHEETKSPERFSIPRQPTTMSTAPNLQQAYASHLQQAYFAESLAFEELQHEWEAPIRRNLVFRSRKTGRRLEIDGAIQAKDKTIIVEVKLLDTKLEHISRRLRDVRDQIRIYREEIPAMGGVDVEFLVVLVISGGEEKYGEVIDKLRPHIAEFAGIANVETYRLQDLMTKYGLSAGPG
ncbi:MAG: hypothetical protein RH982_06285 [Parvibaculum sp.]